MNVEIREARTEADRDAQFQFLVEHAGLDMTWHELIAIANDKTIAGRDERIAAAVMSAANRVRNAELRGLDSAILSERYHALSLTAEMANAHFEVS